MEDFDQWFKTFVRERFPSTTAQQDAGKMMRELQSSAGWQLLLDLVAAREARALADLRRPGRIPEHVEYAHGHGLIEGLRSVGGAAQAVISVAESADEKARKAAESAGR